MRIDTDTEEMKAVASELSGVIKELQSIRYDLTQAIGTISYSWEGPAAKEYILTLKEKQHKIDDLISAVQSTRQFAIDRSQDFLFADQKNASNISNTSSSLDAIGNSIQAALDTISGFFGR